MPCRTALFRNSCNVSRASACAFTTIKKSEPSTLMVQVPGLPVQAAGRTRPHHVDYSFERPRSLIVASDSSRASHRIATMVSRCRAFAMTCTFRLPVGLGILSRNPRTAATHVPYDVLPNIFSLICLSFSHIRLGGILEFSHNQERTSL